jgi:hypothetical protein
MSGLLVLFACLAVAVAIAIPTVARAAGPTNSPPNTMMRKAGGEQEEFLTLNGGIFVFFSHGESNHKLLSTECKDLIVVAHKGDISGPILGKTNATLNGDGSCVYSLKVPADQNVTVGVQPFSWGASKLSPSQFSKLSQQGKLEWKFDKASDVWVKPAFNGDGFPAAVGKDYMPKAPKFKDSVNMPLYIKLNSPGSGSFSGN